MDDRQAGFAEFHVPDPGRIRKVLRWLKARGFLNGGGTGPPAVMEIGYAPGGLLDHVGGAARRVAVDIHAREVGDGIEFVQHDCNEPLAFADDGSFDIVFAGEVIEHLFDDEKFLEEIRRVLRPGGLVAITTPNLFFLVNRIVMPFGRMPYFAYARFHYHIYSRRTLSALVRARGFEIRGFTSSHVLVSTRRHRLIGAVCEWLGDLMPSFGAHLIVFAQR